MNPYKEIESRLAEKDLLFGRIIEKGRGGDVVIGLHQYCPSILHSKRVEEIKSVVGNECRIDWLPNIQEIRITKG